jgi:hypothetical protein
MVTSLLEAHEKARRWALAHAPSSGGQVGLYEFDLGYVAWVIPPPAPRREGPPTLVGAPRLVIDKRTGELSTWPSLSVQAVAERYRQERRAEQRFTAEVRQVLTAAGWYPSRDVSSWVDLWLTELYEQDPSVRRKLPLFPVARTALGEFGGLRFTPLAPADDTCGRSRVELWPTDRPVAVDLCGEFAAAIDALVFPLAWYQLGPGHAVVDDTGRVFLLHPDGAVLLAASVDDAITALVCESDPSGSAITRAARMCPTRQHPTNDMTIRR